MIFFILSRFKMWLFYYIGTAKTFFRHTIVSISFLFRLSAFVDDLLKLAEREGFEPSRQLTPPTRFPSVRLQPLSHLSISFLIKYYNICNFSKYVDFPLSNISKIILSVTSPTPLSEQSLCLISETGFFNLEIE